MDLGLDRRVVLVTGGSDGLGAAAAEALLREGARVAICARDPERLERKAAELATGGGEVLHRAADVTDPAAMAALVDAVRERWGRLDGLVNNAAASSAGAFADLDDERWLADLELKVLAAARLSRLVHEPLREAGGGAIVNVLSISAKAPPAGSMPTSVSRAAGLAMTKGLSREWGPDGIRVNAILIGMVASGQWDRMAERRGVPLPELLEARAADAGVPLGRVGEAAEFGDLAAFLLSPRAAYLSGAAIPFDGALSTAI